MTLGNNAGFRHRGRNPRQRQTLVKDEKEKNSDSLKQVSKLDNFTI
jgi:hypothetical protein